MLDEGTFEEWDAELRPTDPLEFEDRRKYSERLREEQKRTGLRDAAITGTGMIRARRVAFGVTDSAFIMGSMGSVVGERLTRLIERATEQQLPLIIVSGSGGGARMHEGILSLMQMAKVSAALARFDEAGGLFISVLTNPTMGGVAASFASLGDVVFAEPKALIGFAGPRTIKATHPHRAAQGLPDQRVPAGARLHRPHRAPREAEKRNRPDDRLLREVTATAVATCYAYSGFRILAAQSEASPGRSPMHLEKRPWAFSIDFNPCSKVTSSTSRSVLRSLRKAVSGTMSKFYMARDRKNDQIVGLKIADRGKSTAFEARFKGLKKPTEGEIAIKLHHPLVVETYEYGMTPRASQYIVMEFVEGPGLQQLFEQSRSRDWRQPREIDSPDGRSSGLRPLAGVHSSRCLPAELHLRERGAAPSS